ncbi:putative metal-dependent RNase [Thauera phenylacetica B4P]|uniref:Putative metal-dependent RNase n=1 Tax=Thauera phenylacetica B4P TaxID=1234382 RepID=N6ZMF1_9RHOO|nr:putative metal-dependent RNase [Thauera phenylacetica B4P]
MLVVGQRRAGAHQVAVAVHVVHPADRRPVLVAAQAGHRVGGELAAVGVGPLAGDRLRGVRGVDERVVPGVELAAGDLGDLLADRDHRVAEAIELGLRLALGRLDHQRAGHREGHRRRMEAEVHQALGHVVDADAGAVLERTQVEDALVRDQAVLAAVEHRVVRLEALGDVVGVEDRRHRGVAQAVTAHQRDVGPGDRQDAGAAPGRGGDCADALEAHRTVPRQEGREVRLDADRAHARAAAAVRDAEGLVQVQVRDVAAELARAAQADHGVEVGAVDVHLAAVGVHDVGDLAHRGLEHAVGRGVGDHDRGELVGVLRRLGLEVGDVDVAVGVAGDHHHAHAGHVRRGRVGAVRRARDQAHVAVTFAAAGVPGADRQQAGVLALRAGVGLQRHGVVAGAGAQHALELGGELGVALRLVGGREGVQAAELGPGHRDHLGGGVELHGARPERDHRAVERQVLVGQAAQVAQHAGLGLEGAEHRVGQEGGAAQLRGRQRLLHQVLDGIEIEPCGAVAEHLPQRLDIGAAGGLVERDADRAGVDLAQVHARGARGGMHRGGIDDTHGNRVEEGRRRHVRAEAAQAGGQGRGQAMDPARDRRQPGRAVVAGVHAGHDGEQGLRGADVGGGLLAADVLLAGLHRQAVGLLAVAVDRHADHAAGHHALVLVAGGEVRGVRAAEAHRDAEALGRADGDVGAELARGLEQGEREQVGGDHHQRLPVVRGGDDGGVVGHLAGARRVLQQHAEDLVRGEFGRGVADDDLEAERLGAGAHHLDGLRVAVARDEEGLGLALRQALAEGHGLGRGGGLVEQRGVGDLQAGEVGDHGLEVEQRLQATLRDLGLVRGVGGVPGRVLEHVAQDDRGREGVVVARADERAQHPVLARDRAQQRQRLGLAAAFGQGQRRDRQDGGGDDLVDQLVERVEAEHVEHGARLGGVRAHVAADEVVALLELRERRGEAGVVDVHGRGGPGKGEAGGIERTAPIRRSAFRRRPGPAGRRRRRNRRDGCG